MTIIDDLINISELLGREVEVYTKNRGGKHIGILHSMGEHGILIRDAGSYRFFPWESIRDFVHYTEPPSEETEAPTIIGEGSSIAEDEALDKDWSPIIVDDPLTAIAKHFPNEEYSVERDEDEGVINIEDGEGETAIVIDDVELKSLTVFYDKDFEMSKKIAKELKIKTIVRKYE